jgi:aerobic-type carbon monoxide dehydrogenase small subunit (CoxS/CutS family)
MKVVEFRLNGLAVRAQVEPAESLIETLRALGETTARESCGVGLCGCCAVLVNGLAVSSCLYWSVAIEGADVTTLRGLDGDGITEALQQAIAEQGGAQCGYCTPGMVVTARELLAQEPAPTREQVREYMSGNLCRCACYPELIRAVETAVVSRAPDADRDQGEPGAA